MNQQRICIACKQPFEVPATSKKRFCSVACWPAPGKHSRRKRDRVIMSCGQCGGETERTPFQVKVLKEKGWQAFCSTACRDDAKRGRKGERRVARVTLTCEDAACGKTFEVAPHEQKGRRFCSRRCANKHIPGQPVKLDSRTINSRGYAHVYVPPEERPPGYGGMARHPEHRYVMYKMLGRWPTRHESVHHINGDKTDNRPENLQLRSGSHGRGLAIKCRCCGSSDFEYVELDDREREPRLWV